MSKMPSWIGEREIKIAELFFPRGRYKVDAEYDFPTDIRAKHCLRSQVEMRSIRMIKSLISTNSPKIAGYDTILPGGERLVDGFFPRKSS
jgi:hypothetical protein